MDPTLSEAEQAAHAPATIEAGFYHLTRMGIDQALPLLLGRVLQAKNHAVVKCGSKAQVKALDGMLWKTKNPFWLPHGSGADKQAKLNPIWITEGEDTPNNPNCLFLVGGADYFIYEGCQRVFVLFDAHEQEELSWARLLWKELSTHTHVVRTYWQQGPSGWSAQKQV